MTNEQNQDNSIIAGFGGLSHTARCMQILSDYANAKSTGEDFESLVGSLSADLSHSQDRVFVVDSGEATMNGHFMFGSPKEEEPARLETIHSFLGFNTESVAMDQQDDIRVDEAIFLPLCCDEIASLWLPSFQAMVVPDGVLPSQEKLQEWVCEAGALGVAPSQGLPTPKEQMRTFVRKKGGVRY